MTSVPLKPMWMTLRWTAADTWEHRATRWHQNHYLPHQLIKSSKGLFENTPALWCFLSLICVGLSGGDGAGARPSEAWEPSRPWPELRPCPHGNESALRKEPGPALPCLWNCPESSLWAEAMGRNHCVAKQEAGGSRGLQQGDLRKWGQGEGARWPLATAGLPGRLESCCWPSPKGWAPRPLSCRLPLTA